MNISHAPSPVKFSSRLKFVSEDDFDEQLWEKDGKEAMIARGEYAHYPWEIESRVKLKPEALTDDIYDCSTVSVDNGEALSSAHLHPGRTLSRHAQKTQEGLASDVSDLSGKGPLHALVLGGRAYKDGKEVASRNLFHMILGVLQHSGVQQISTIWGRKSLQDDGPIRQLYDRASDTWFIHAISRGRDVLSRKDIDRTFEIVDIAPCDSLEPSA